MLKLYNYVSNCSAIPLQADGRLTCYCLSANAFRDLLGSQEEIWRFEHLKEVGACVLACLCLSVPVQTHCRQ